VQHTSAGSHEAGDDKDEDEDEIDRWEARSKRKNGRKLLLVLFRRATRAPNGKAPVVHSSEGKARSWVVGGKLGGWKVRLLMRGDGEGRSLGRTLYLLIRLK
jgi:hypothetical protein